MRQKTEKINGKDYKLQSIPFKSYIGIVDSNTNKNGVLEKSGYSEALLKHCVIEPKVTMDSFDDDFSTGMKLVAAVETFLTTKDKSETDKGKGEE